MTPELPKTEDETRRRRAKERPTLGSGGTTKGARSLPSGSGTRSARIAGIGVFFGVTLLCASPALAQVERTSSLGWTRLASAEPCIGPRELAEGVEAQLGKAVFVSAAHADIAVEGYIERVDGAWHAVLAISDKAGKVLGTRELSKSSSECRDLDEDLVLAVALMIDPTSALAPAPPVTPSPVRAPPAPPVAPSPPRAPPGPPTVVFRTVAVPAQAPEPPRPWSASVLLGPSFSMGLLPSFGAGLTMRATITPPRFIPIAAGGTFWFSNDATLGATGAEIQLAEGFIALCPLVAKLSALSFQGCGGGRIGSLHANGFGFALNDQKERVTVSAALEAHLALRVAGPLVLSAGPSVVFPFVRDTLAYDDVRKGAVLVFRMSPVAGILDTSLGFELP